MISFKFGIVLLLFTFFVWEERKLGEISNIIAGGDKNINKIKKYGKYPVIANSINKNGIVGYYDNEYRVKAPAVTVTGRGEIGHAVARFQNFTPIVRLLALSSKLDPIFLANSINKIRFFNESTGVPQLTKPQLSTYSIIIPSVEEQNNIGKLILLIEKYIHLQQRKLKLLKVMKKALSQYMFCQETEFVPILRFNSFSDKWKYERLKKLIIKEIKGKAKADMKGTKSTYIDTALLNGGSITKVDSPTDTFHNDIIILWDGSQAGKIYHGFTGALGSTLKSYKPKYSGGFLYQYLKSKEPIIFLRYRTPNIPHVVKDFTEIFKINVPSVKEQEKISKTLNYLDQSILVETKKIGSIKKIKKFLLQNMFI
ncbi:restriction endonuclease subunit S [Lactobacillus helveticus]|uniref:restriction endonuclease subunit S n=1 Tax=Lactobacillus helveticus TaxID=1587 RepID=UPI0035312960